MIKQKGDGVPQESGAEHLHISLPYILMVSRLLLAFLVAADDPEFRHFAALNFQSTAVLKYAPYHHSIDVFSWMKHTEGEHPVCRGVKLEGGGL